MSLKITEELIARQSPEAQVIIRLLLARIAEQDRRIADLEARLHKTPQNSSLPPGTQHPHAKAPPHERSPGRTGVGSRGIRSTSGSSSLLQTARPSSR